MASTNPTLDDEKTLESLYNLNKHAKKYANLAEKNYRRGKGATAKSNSVKKQALYELKSDVLQELYDNRLVDSVTRHVIDGREYWYLEIGDWGYHAPTDQIHINTDHDIVDEQTEEIDDFDKSEKKERSDLALKSSLLHVQSVFGLSANDYLSEKKVYYGTSGYFTGWKYLD